VSEILRQIEQARTAQQENEQRHDVQLEIPREPIQFDGTDRMGCITNPEAYDEPDT
jgi:hypothetical protein